MEPFRPYRGFSLVELLVVLGIIMFLASVVLTSQSNFNKTLVLANTAYDIALSIRGAETYGLGSRTTSAGIGNAPYGVHFESGSQTSFELFADTSPPVSCTIPTCSPGDRKYTNGSDTRIQTYNIQNGIRVTDFCINTNGWTCVANGLTYLDISFLRPYPEPIFKTNTSSLFPVTQACITVYSPYGGSRSVRVDASGLVSVGSTACP
jgi:type II secretory pathway pseudopilin PulG